MAAREVHNLEVAGSTPAPAPKVIRFPLMSRGRGPRAGRLRLVASVQLPEWETIGEITAEHVDAVIRAIGESGKYVRIEAWETRYGAADRCVAAWRNIT